MPDSDPNRRPTDVCGKNINTAATRGTCDNVPDSDPDRRPTDVCGKNINTAATRDSFPTSLCRCSAKIKVYRFEVPLILPLRRDVSLPFNAHAYSYKNCGRRMFPTRHGCGGGGNANHGLRSWQQHRAFSRPAMLMSREDTLPCDESYDSTQALHHSHSVAASDTTHTNQIRHCEGFWTELLDRALPFVHHE